MLVCSSTRINETSPRSSFWRIVFHEYIDTWGLPGGHLEFGESFETCGERELLEETGLAVRNLKYWTATNSVFKDVVPNKHYVTIFIGGTLRDEGAQPQVSTYELQTILQIMFLDLRISPFSCFKFHANNLSRSWNPINARPGNGYLGMRLRLTRRRWSQVQGLRRGNFSYPWWN